VFVCQNNLYGEKTPVEKSMHVERIADRASAYGMAGTRVNGNDPDEVYGALHQAVERARTGGGPSLVECMTFRFRGHSMGDDMKYIPQEQMAWAEANDPVPTYRQRLLSSGVSTERELNGMEEAAAQSVKEALETVLAAPSPSIDELSEHLYANPDKTPV
jgi:pyruvate dehydrogenase E1 component alpha subunit